MRVCKRFPAVPRANLSRIFVIFSGSYPPKPARDVHGAGACVDRRGKGSKRLLVASTVQSVSNRVIRRTSVACGPREKPRYVIACGFGPESFHRFAGSAVSPFPSTSTSSQRCILCRSKKSDLQMVYSRSSLLQDTLRRTVLLDVSGRL